MDNIFNWCVDLLEFPASRLGAIKLPPVHYHHAENHSDTSHFSQVFLASAATGEENRMGHIESRIRTIL
jgi:hypothetical protein